MLKAFKVLRGILVVLVIAVYAILVHHVNTSGQPSLLGALLALAPLFLITLIFALKRHSKLLGLAFILVFLIACWLLLPAIKQHTALIFWLQDIGLMLILLLTFARTLQPGRKALCISFAEIINGGTLPADHERYAYRVTIAWVIFFSMMILISTLLFFLASLESWSFFVNFLTLPLVAAMFIAEFIIRKQVLTDLPATNVLDAVRAYLHSKRHNQ